MNYILILLFISGPTIEAKYIGEYESEELCKKARTHYMKVVPVPRVQFPKLSCVEKESI
jgi:hypothetical protein